MRSLLEDRTTPRMRWPTIFALASLLAGGVASYTRLRADVAQVQQQVSELNCTGTRGLKAHTDMTARELQGIAVQNAQLQVELQLFRAELEKRLDRIERSVR